MKAGRRLSWLVVLVVGVVLFEQVRRVLIDTQNPNLLPALILLGAAIVPAAFTAFLFGRDLHATVSAGMLAVTALVGGVVGIVVAGSLEYRTLQRLGTVPLFTVGLAEEAAKLIAPLFLVVFLRRYVASPANGLLLGVASGAGFAALETMGYAFVTLVQSNGNLGAVDGVLLLRGLLSPAAHMTWTGLTAAALWQAAEHRYRGRPLAVFVVTFLVAVGLHTAWDACTTTGDYAVVAAASLVLLGISTHHIGRLSHLPPALAGGWAAPGEIRQRQRAAVGHP